MWGDQWEQEHGGRKTMKCCAQEASAMCTGRVGPRRDQTPKMIWEWIVHARFEEHLKWRMSKDNNEEEKGEEAIWMEVFVHTAGR